MRNHIYSTFAVLVMVVLAFGSTDSNQTNTAVSSGNTRPNASPKTTASDAVVPDDVSYETERHDVRPPIKRSVKVHLNKRVTEQTVQAIVDEVRGSVSGKFEREFYSFHIQGEEGNDWAMARYVNGAPTSLEIFGVPKEMADAFTAKANTPEIMGKWIEWKTVTTLYYREGKVQLEQKYKDATVLTTALHYLPGSKSFVEPETKNPDEIYKITAEGNLQLWDGSFLWSDVRPLEFDKEKFAQFIEELSEEKTDNETKSSLALNSAKKSVPENEHAPEIRERIDRIKYETSVLLKELLAFKDKPDFHEWGFAIAGPYNQWLKRVDELSDSPLLGPKGTSANRISIELRIAPGELRQVAMDFMRNKGRETQYIRDILPEIENTIGFREFLSKPKGRKTTSTKPTEPDGRKEEFRTWKTSDGNYETIGRYKYFAQGKVAIEKKEDGEVIKVDLNILSPEDQKYVGEIRNKK